MGLSASAKGNAKRMILFIFFTFRKAKLCFLFVRAKLFERNIHIEHNIFVAPYVCPLHFFLPFEWRGLRAGVR